MKVAIQTRQTVKILVPLEDRTIPSEATVLSAERDTFDTSLPQRNGVKIPVKVDRLSVTFAMPDATYTMQCPVVMVGSEGLSLAIPPDEEIVRVQRRQYVRVASAIPCEIEAVPPGDSTIATAARLKDISGGGCGLVVEKPITLGTMLQLSMTIPEEGSMILLGCVRHCTPSGRPGTQHVAGVEFVALDESTRSKIIRYVYSIQRAKIRPI